MLVKVYRYRVRPELASRYLQAQERAAALYAAAGAEPATYLRSVDDPQVWIEMHRQPEDPAARAALARVEQHPELPGLWREFQATLDPRYPTIVEEFREESFHSGGGAAPAKGAAPAPTVIVPPAPPRADANSASPPAAVLVTPPPSGPTLADETVGPGDVDELDSEVSPEMATSEFPPAAGSAPVDSDGDQDVILGELSGEEGPSTEPDLAEVAAVEPLTGDVGAWSVPEPNETIAADPIPFAAAEDPPPPPQETQETPRGGWPFVEYPVALPSPAAFAPRQHAEPCEDCPREDVLPPPFELPPGVELLTAAEYELRQKTAESRPDADR